MLKNKWFKNMFFQLVVVTAVVGLQSQPIYLQPQPPQPILCQQNALPAKPGIRNGCECAGGNEGVCEKLETAGWAYYKYSKNACDGIKAVGEVYRGRVLVSQAPCVKPPICDCPVPSSVVWEWDRVITDNHGTLFQHCTPPCYPTSRD
jgi:hypothetical protein